MIDGMWFVAIIPAIAAAAIGLVTYLSPEIPGWKRKLVIALTAVTIVAISINQWWEHHERVEEAERRTQTLEQLAKFIGQGEKLMAEISDKSDQPVPNKEAQEWFDNARTFLRTLGQSYVTRFESMAGLTTINLGHGDTEHNNLWVGIRGRVIRLHEFSAEFSGQVPKVASGNPF